jgi:nitric oxide dioxygenase
LRRQVVSDVLGLRNASLHLWYEKGDQTREPVDGCHAGMIDLSQVELPDNATYYMCGPPPFMQAVRSALIERRVSRAPFSMRSSGRTSGRPTSRDGPVVRRPPASTQRKILSAPARCGQYYQPSTVLDVGREGIGAQLS